MNRKIRQNRSSLPWANGNDPASSTPGMLAPQSREGAGDAGGRPSGWSRSGVQARPSPLNGISLLTGPDRAGAACGLLST
jgi:hypothetical protein